MRNTAPSPFGVTPAGPAHLYRLENDLGFRAELTDYGAALVGLHTPDRDGRMGNVVLGYGRAEDYAAQPFFFGATIGRFANRIAGGKFTLDDVTHQLPLNDGPPGARGQLHGGANGFHRHLWQVNHLAERSVQATDPTARIGNCRAGVLHQPTLCFSRRSPDGEEGYPGNLDVSVRYSIPARRNELLIEYNATCDRPTPINLTHHSYFNLFAAPKPGEGGRGHRDILGHRLQVEASAYTPVNGALIPTGELRPVAGTPFDFRTPHVIGARIGVGDEQLRIAGGYDHNFVVAGDSASAEMEGRPPCRPFPALAATVHDPHSGRTMQVLTTEPGLQFYSGNFLAQKHAGLCLETQHFPDSPNQPAFPSTILRPGDVFRSGTTYRFSVGR